MFGSQPLVCVGSVPPFKVVSIVGVVSRMWEAFRCADGDSYWTGKIFLRFRFLLASAEVSGEVVSVGVAGACTS